MDSKNSKDGIIFDGDLLCRLESDNLYPRPGEAKDPLQRWLLRRYYDSRSPDSPYKKVVPVRPAGGLELRLRLISGRGR